jgi:hypothetical protein
MKQVTLTELQEIMDNAFSDKDDTPRLVIMNLEGCHHCELLKKAILAEDILSQLEAVAELYELVIDDKIPLFAPPVMPSVVCFKYGVRVWEGLGYPDTIQAMVDSFKDWLQNNINDSISVSDGYRSV